MENQKVKKFNPDHWEWENNQWVNWKTRETMNDSVFKLKLYAQQLQKQVENGK